MNNNATNRNVAAIDSRRMASGTICEIISDPKIIRFIAKYSLMPEGVQIDPETGYDKTVPALLAIPFYKVPELKNLINGVTLAENSLTNSVDTLERSRLVEAARYRIKEFLKKNMILVYFNILQPGIMGPRLPSDLSRHQVLVDTIEVSPSNGEILEMNIISISTKNNWTKKVK